MAGDPNDIPRGVKLFAAFWPAALALGAVLVSGARSDAQVQGLKERTDYIFQNGSPQVVERLGRIEEHQLVLIQAVDRIEKKLDDQEGKR